MPEKTESSEEKKSTKAATKPSKSTTVKTEATKRKPSEKNSKAKIAKEAKIATAAAVTALGVSTKAAPKTTAKRKTENTESTETSPTAKRKSTVKRTPVLSARTEAPENKASSLPAPIPASASAPETKTSTAPAVSQVIVTEAPKPLAPRGVTRISSPPRPRQEIVTPLQDTTPLAEKNSDVRDNREDKDPRQNNRNNDRGDRNDRSERYNNNRNDRGSERPNNRNDYSERPERPERNNEKDSRFSRDNKQSRFNNRSQETTYPFVEPETVGGQDFDGKRGNKRRRNRNKERGMDTPNYSNNNNASNVDTEELSKKAWRIFLGEITEDGLALMDDNSTKEVARRAFRVAEIFLQEEARRANQSNTPLAIAQENTKQETPVRTTIKTIVEEVTPLDDDDEIRPYDEDEDDA